MSRTVMLFLLLSLSGCEYAAGQMREQEMARLGLPDTGGKYLMVYTNYDVWGSRLLTVQQTDSQKSCAALGASLMDPHSLHNHFACKPI